MIDQQVFAWQMNAHTMLNSIYHDYFINQLGLLYGTLWALGKYFAYDVVNGTFLKN